MVLFTCLPPTICWYNYWNRAAVFCFVVRTLVRPSIILSTIWLPFSNLPIQKFIRFFEKQGWINGKSRKLIRWITAEILLLFKCLSYMYHEEQGCIFSYKKIPIFHYTLGKRIVIFLLPEALCILKYAENVIAAGPLPRTPLGELTTLSQTPLVGWVTDTPPHTPPHSAPQSSCPLTPNPGDATGHHHFLR